MTRIIIPIIAASAEEAREIQSALNEVLAQRRKAQEKPNRQEQLIRALDALATRKQQEKQEEARRQNDMAAILARQTAINRLRPSKERFMPLTPKVWPREFCR